ncbi:MAG TPA: hypothetical protein VJM34_07520 [Novosphingobium sp.]|nr:hypothetical protein [Novosphingobium sp.]
MSDESKKGISGAAALAGAAIGSAAIAAALLYVKRRREKNAETRFVPPHPEKAPETD